MFRGAPNLRFRQGEVVHVDLDAKHVTLADSTRLDYDFCVLATGSVTNYYGKSEVAQHALGLKDLGEALKLRNHVLDCFERATTAVDSEVRSRRLTFCIVGAGPTGVEYAGALAEFVRLVVPDEYPELATSRVRIILLEGGDRLLPTFKPRLSAYARRELELRGVEVRLNTLVESVDDAGVVLHDGSELATATMVWTAGVCPTKVLESEPGRVHVDDHFRIAGAIGAYAIGDVAAGLGPRGRCSPCCRRPRCRPAATSRARSSTVHRRDRFATGTRGVSPPSVAPRPSARSDRSTFTGFVGWIVWLVVHLYYLIGFENRLQVLLRWAWYYVHLDRPVRMVIRAHPPPRVPDDEATRRRM